MTLEEQHLPPLSQRRAHLAPAGRLWLARGRTVVIVVVAMLPLVYVWLAPSLRWNEYAEARNTPLRTGQALVVDKILRVTPSKGVPGPAVLWITFRIEGKNLTVSAEAEKWERANKGDTVAITYHVGRQGSYFIEDWQPPVHIEQRPLHP